MLVGTRQEIWWYVRMPKYPKTLPLNKSAPYANASKIFYDPEMYYYFTVPTWKEDAEDAQNPFIPGYDIFLIVNIISLISISIILVKKQTKSN